MNMNSLSNELERIASAQTPSITPEIPKSPRALKDEIVDLIGRMAIADFTKEIYLENWKKNLVKPLGEAVEEKEIESNKPEYTSSPNPRIVNQFWKIFSGCFDEIANVEATNVDFPILYSSIKTAKHIHNLVQTIRKEEIQRLKMDTRVNQMVEGYLGISSRRGNQGGYEAYKNLGLEFGAAIAERMKEELTPFVSLNFGEYLKPLIENAFVMRDLYEQSPFEADDSASPWASDITSVMESGAEEEYEKIIFYWSCEKLNQSHKLSEYMDFRNAQP